MKPYGMRCRRAGAGRALAALLFLLALPGQAPAQIVNTQPLVSRLGAEGLSGEFRGSLDWRTGNSELLRLVGSALFFLRAGDNALISSSKLDYGKSGAADFVSQLFTHLRYQRRFTPAFTWEVFVQASTAKTKRLDLRVLAGSGPRLELVSGESASLAFGLAWMFEHERIQDDGGADAGATTSHQRLSSYLSGRFAVTPTLTCTQTVYFQPRLDAFRRDFRVLSTSDLAVRLTERLSLAVSFELAWDREPPETVRELDTTMLFGVALGF